MDQEEIKPRFEQFLTDECAGRVREFARTFPSARQFTFSWDKLSQYDTALAKQYQLEPKSTQKYLDKALQFSDAHDAICLVNAWTTPDTGPTETHLHELIGSSVGALTTVPARISNTEPLARRIRIGGYRCRDCDHLNRVYDPWCEASEPHHCEACGLKRVEFELDEEYSQFVPHRTVELTDATHLLYEFEQPKAVTVDIFDPSATDVEIEDWVCCTAIVSKAMDGSGGITDRLLVYHAQSDTPDEIIHRADIDERPLRAPSTRDTHLSAFETADVTLERAHLVGYTNHVQSLVDAFESESEMTEEDVKVKIINPLLELLGWDIYGPEVRMEYPVVNYSSQKSVDYALLVEGEPVVCVEAKSPVKAVARNALDQLYEYMRVLDAEWGILTNGWEYTLVRKGTTNTPNQLANFTVELTPNNIELLDKYCRDSF